MVMILLYRTVSSFNFFVKKERKIDTYGKFLLNYECIRHTVFGRFALSVLLNCSYLCGVYRKYRIFIFITGDYYLLYNTSIAETYAIQLLIAQHQKHSPPTLPIIVRRKKIVRNTVGMLSTTSSLTKINEKDYDIIRNNGYYSIRTV
jgi:hypothetical protein